MEKVLIVHYVVTYADGVATLKCYASNTETFAFTHANPTEAVAIVEVLKNISGGAHQYQITQD